MGSTQSTDAVANLIRINTLPTKAKSQAPIDPTLLKKVLQIIPDYQRDENIVNLIKNVVHSSTGKFIDNTFQLSQQAQPMGLLYPKQTLKKMSLYDNSNIDVVQQQEVRLSYLSAIQSAIGWRLDLKERMKETLILNDEGMYCFNMHPNGHPAKVIVDSFVPVKKQDLLFAGPLGNELWAMLMEKAWCKLVGGYTQAYSLSCEEAFEEITGAPAYTYALNNSFLNKSIHPSHCVFFIAKKGSTQVTGDQVVFLEQQVGNQYTLCSPYTLFNFQEGKRDKRHRVTIPSSSLLKNFDIAVIGYSIDSYVPHHLQIHSAPQQSLLYKIVIQRKEQVGIRFTQHYKGYTRSEYRYSPVMMELFMEENDKYYLVPEAMGCGASMTLSKSVNAHTAILGEMVGTYYLRLSVQWRHPDVRTGRLVVYASEANAQITPIPDCNNKLKHIFSSIVSNTMFTKGTEENLESLGVRLQIIELKDYSVLAITNTLQTRHTVYVAIKEPGEGKDASNIQVNRIPYTRPIEVNFEPNQGATKLLFLQPLDYTKDYSMGRYIVTNTPQ